jgi:hypothetical protein
LADFNHGLALLGWARDGRLTNDDELSLKQVADKAIAAEARFELTDALRDELAEEAFRFLEFQILNVDERTTMISGP